MNVGKFTANPSEISAFRKPNRTLFNVVFFKVVSSVVRRESSFLEKAFQTVSNFLVLRTEVF